MKTMNRREAKAAGYRALTSRYELPREQWMLDAVLADMRRAKVNHVVVRDRLGLSVWRSARTMPMRVDANVRNVTPHPSPSPQSWRTATKGRGVFSFGKHTRGGGLAAFRLPSAPQDGCPRRDVRSAKRGPRATVLNPAGVLKFGRLRRRTGRKKVLDVAGRRRR
jgi:hypothetical protein